MAIKQLSTQPSSTERRPRMCFGPTAAFTTSAALAAIGAGTLRKVHISRETLFAAIPLLFSVQAASEGFLWLALTHKNWEHLQLPLSLFFLFFAYLVWPVFTPLALYFVEPSEKRRKGILWMLGSGAGTAAYLLFLVLTQSLQVYTLNHSIRYETTRRPTLLLLFYLAAAVGPYLISTFKHLRILGVLNLFFCIAAYLLYSKTFDSVWCFFAAVSSAGIYFFIRSPRPSSQVRLRLSE